MTGAALAFAAFGIALWLARYSRSTPSTREVTRGRALTPYTRRRQQASFDPTPVTPQRKRQLDRLWIVDGDGR